jgi:hypothetical protein
LSADGVLIGYIGIERAAQSHIDQLQPTADPQERFALVDGLAQEVQFQLVSLRIDLVDLRVGLGAIALRLDIPASAEQQAIQARE